MSMARPHIGKIRKFEWHDRRTNERTPGIMLYGLDGMAGHLTPDEAYTLADKLVDLADSLAKTTSKPPAPSKPAFAQIPVHTTRSLTSACGDDEPELPTSSLEME